MLNNSAKYKPFASVRKDKTVRHAHDDRLRFRTARCERRMICSCQHAAYAQLDWRCEHDYSRLAPSCICIICAHVTHTSHNSRQSPMTQNKIAVTVPSFEKYLPSSIQLVQPYLSSAFAALCQNCNGRLSRSACLGGSRTSSAHIYASSRGRPERHGRPSLPRPTVLRMLIFPTLFTAQLSADKVRSYLISRRLDVTSSCHIIFQPTSTYQEFPRVLALEVPSPRLPLNAALSLTLPGKIVSRSSTTTLNAVFPGASHTFCRTQNDSVRNVGAVSILGEFVHCRA